MWLRLPVEDRALEIEISTRRFGPFRLIRN